MYEYAIFTIQCINIHKIALNIFLSEIDKYRMSESSKYVRTINKKLFFSFKPLTVYFFCYIILFVGEFYEVQNEQKREIFFMA